MAIEDGAILTRCLSHDTSISDALQRYERIRLPRASKLQNASRNNCTTFHLPDEPEQQTRDASFSSRSGTGSEALAVFDSIQGYDALRASID